MTRPSPAHAFAGLLLGALLLAPLAGCDSRRQSSTSSLSYRERIAKGETDALSELAGRGANALPDLILLMQDSNPSVVVNAVALVERLDKSTAAAAIPQLVGTLRIDGVRQRAEYALSAFGAAAVPELTKAIEGGDAVLATRAAGVMAKGIGKAGKPAIPGLTRLLETGSDEAKLHAIGALASIGSAAEPSVPAIQKIADTATGNLKTAALNAIKRIEDAKKPGQYTDSR